MEKTSLGLAKHNVLPLHERQRQLKTIKDGEAKTLYTQRDIGLGGPFFSDGVESIGCRARRHSCSGFYVGHHPLKAVVDAEIEKTFSLGGCTLTVVAPGPNGPTVTGLETGQALWLEIICGFVFLFASGWMAFDQRQAKALGRVNVFIIIGIVLGLLVFISTTVTATKGYAGAGLNPARCLGPAIVRGGHLWDGHWVFWVGPAIACVAFALYTKLIPHQLSYTI
ncbi:AQUAPORIN AQPAN.G-LIKE [Salix purpurea]|uniref:AQUAPORIN AQPAN.G-LIKE n=1 Tax=Salix purpurea TaxID=77065 RepID=A0A9Q0PRR0_SALPP|nr:AQUAPORIN AQPAN.G-LIKE [Salix purpurea]